MFPARGYGPRPVHTGHGLSLPPEELRSRVPGVSAGTRGAFHASGSNAAGATERPGPGRHRAAGISKDEGPRPPCAPETKVPPQEIPRCSPAFSGSGYFPFLPLPCAGKRPSLSGFRLSGTMSLFCASAARHTEARPRNRPAFRLLKEGRGNGLTPRSRRRRTFRPFPDARGRPRRFPAFRRAEKGVRAFAWFPAARDLTVCASAS